MSSSRQPRQQPQIDDNVRRRLLDNYLRNQQLTSQPAQTHAGSSQSQHLLQSQQPSFHPSQFQHHYTSPVFDPELKSETFSESRYSVRTSMSAPPSTQQPRSDMVNTVQVRDLTVVQSSTTPQEDLQDNISVENFSVLVKKWIELDNWIKKSQEVVKQKRKQKEKLGDIITHYMCRYNIEDVNTSEGKIRCKVRYVKSGVNQKVVKEKISEVLKDNEETCNTLMTKIFEERDKVERVSLRRIKIT